MRPTNLIILFVAIVMGGIAAFLTRNWIESHSGAYADGDSAGTHRRGGAAPWIRRRGKRPTASPKFRG